jgi:exosortase A
MLSLAWITLFFFDTAAAMVKIWSRSDTFAHGFVVAPISLWLIWRVRDRLRQLSPQPNFPMLVLMVASGFAWLLGEVSAVNALTQFAFVAMLVFAAPTLLGVAVARVILFPLAFLFFAVPFGEFLMPALMSYTADFTIFALRASGVPVYREGLQFVIPTGRWSIVEACSGIRYLIASVVVGTLFAYLNFSSLRKRLAFIGISIAVPIVANWLRAYGIVMLGHLSQNRIATGVDHLVYGWLFFGLVMIVMFWIGMRFRDDADQLPDASLRITASIGPPPAGGAPVAAAVVGIFLATLPWPMLDRAIVPTDASAKLSPIDVAGWERVPANGPAFVPHFQRPSAVLHEAFAKDGRQIGVYVAFYRAQTADRKLVSSDNVLVSSEDHRWHTIASNSRPISLGGRATEVATSRIRATSGEVLTAWHGYWVDGVLTASGVAAKARIALQMLTGRGDDSAAIVVYTIAHESAGMLAESTLQKFIADAWPALSRTLEHAGSAAP